ncbi:hypothetical protein ZX61_18335 [Vibrio sp. VPAP30]|nr:hypothetical protein ZX61_18335 [Vibrio sp. VPAP30]
MDYILYLLVSFVSLYLSHRLSMKYTESQSNIIFCVYFLFMAYTGSQHYNIFFNGTFFESWFFVEFDQIHVDGLFKTISLIMLILNVMTIPPSKFRRVSNLLRK